MGTNIPIGKDTFVPTGTFVPFGKGTPAPSIFFAIFMLTLSFLSLAERHLSYQGLIDPA
jgi:hypothetical protein